MNILITRPSPSGEELVNKLIALGKTAYHLPLISFSEGKNLPLLIKQINSLSQGDFLFIVSQHAVRYAHSYLLSIGKSWPPQLEYYSIGQATSVKMYTLSGISSKYPVNKETSEKLLQLPELIYIRGRRALVLRGNNGRTILDSILRQRGAQVMWCECYKRQPLKYNGTKEYYRMQKLNIKTIVITTGEMLQQLYYLIPQSYRITWLIHCRLIVSSARIATLAKYLGWKDIIIAQSAQNNTLLQTLIKYT